MPGNPLSTRPPEVGTGGRVMRERTRAPFFQRVLKLVSRGSSGGLLVNAIFAHLLDQRRALQRQQTRGFRNDAAGQVVRKSVGSGRCVSVRVDLGGCRTIQKKT